MLRGSQIAFSEKCDYTGFTLGQLVFNLYIIVNFLLIERVLRNKCLRMGLINKLI